MKTVGIIGASGYVGRHIATLLSGDFRVTALQRNIHAVTPPLPGVTITSLRAHTETFDILINTSYSQHKDIENVYSQNHEVLEQIKRASHASTRIIHLSSLAVFGFGLDKPIIPGPVELQNDYMYVQSKVHMENLLLQHIAHEHLSIIRLGNVWGPANNSWTQPVADALQWGLPVMSKTPAFSNITYVHNIADYIRYIINSTDHLLFHHLAEFSDITWQQVIEELSIHLKTNPVPISTIPYYAKNLSDDLQHAIDINPVATLKNIRNGRFYSHHFPQRLLNLLDFYRSKKFTLKQIPYEPSVTFYWILGCKTEFKPARVSGWHMPYKWEDVKTHVFTWLDTAGFTCR
jgi:nucleoside-diphosphate-sugar epimerase